MSEIIQNVKFPPRSPYRKWLRDVHRQLQPGQSVIAHSQKEAHAICLWGRSKPRFWQMRRLKQSNGTFLVGRTR